MVQCALAVDLADSYYVGEKEKEEPVFTKNPQHTKRDERPCKHSRGCQWQSEAGWGGNKIEIKIKRTTNDNATEEKVHSCVCSAVR